MSSIPGLTSAISAALPFLENARRQQQAAAAAQPKPKKKAKAATVPAPAARPARAGMQDERRMLREQYQSGFGGQLSDKRAWERYRNRVAQLDAIEKQKARQELYQTRTRERVAANKAAKAAKATRAAPTPTAAPTAAPAASTTAAPQSTQPASPVNPPAEREMSRIAELPTTETPARRFDSIADIVERARQFAARTPTGQLAALAAPAQAPAPAVPADAPPISNRNPIEFNTLPRPTTADQALSNLLIDQEADRTGGYKNYYGLMSPEDQKLVREHMAISGMGEPGLDTPFTVNELRRLRGQPGERPRPASQQAPQVGPSGLPTLPPSQAVQDRMNLLAPGDREEVAYRNAVAERARLEAQDVADANRAIDAQEAANPPRPVGNSFDRMDLEEQDRQRANRIITAMENNPFRRSGQFEPNASGRMAAEQADIAAANRAIDNLEAATYPRDPSQPEFEPNAFGRMDAEEYDRQAANRAIDAQEAAEREAEKRAEDDWRKSYAEMRRLQDEDLSRALEMERVKERYTPKYDVFARDARFLDEAFKVRQEVDAARRDRARRIFAERMRPQREREARLQGQRVQEGLTEAGMPLPIPAEEQRALDIDAERMRLLNELVRPRRPQSLLRTMPGMRDGPPSYNFQQSALPF